LPDNREAGANIARPPPGVNHFSPMLQTLASLLLALFKAIPALEGMFARLQTEMARQRETTAAQRRAAKDAAVDEAIDRHP
jgi:hypothetical protein